MPPFYHSRMFDQDFEELDPPVVFVVDPFRLHDCMDLFYGAAVGGVRPRIINLHPQLNRGRNPRESLNNLWIGLKLYMMMQSSQMQERSMPLQRSGVFITIYQGKRHTNS